MPRKPKEDGRPPVNLRRMYVDCRHGQLHLRSAFPSSGGFDEMTTLVCLGPGASTSRLFAGFLASMGHDRSVYAPDLPGFGESDPPPPASSTSDLAAAVGDFIDHMRFRQVDLLGYEAGVVLASALAAARPETVRRVVLAAPLAEDLPGHGPLLQQPVLVLRPIDAAWTLTARVREGLPGARFVDLEERATGLIDLTPEVVAHHARRFLD
jgi:pimeloyl-ACP methyl ester carboxylesterase